MRTTGICLALGLLGACGWAQTAIDAYTTFKASFDDGLLPDYCAGDWRAGVSGEAELVEGRFGNALFLPEGKSLSYKADGKINLAAGTIEFWLLWTEELAEAEEASLFGMVSEEQGNYVNFNKIQGERLGMPVKGGPAEEGKWTWQRVDVDFTTWEVGTWHHIAGTWEGGVTRIYADGELAEEEAGGAGLIEAPPEFSLGRGPLTIDELRISSIARSPEEIAAAAAAQPGEPASRYLTDLEPSDRGQALGVVGIDHQTAIDDREIPLVIGNRAYARGVALRAPGFVEFEVPEGFARLRGVLGVSPFGRAGASATVAFSLDGEESAVTPNISADAEPTPLDMAVQGGQTLRIEARVAGDEAGAVAVLGDAILLAEGIEPPPSFSRQMEPDELTMQTMRTEVAEFSFELPEAPNGYAIYAGHPVDEVDPALEPLGERFPEALAMQASPGEYEAVQFTLCAAQDLPSIRVTAGGLSGDAGTIPDDRVQVQLIRRVLMRKGYWMPRVPTNYETVSRFVFPNRDFWLPAGNFKEIYLLVHVPEDAAAGDYTGTVRVEPEGLEPSEMALQLHVHPIELVQPQNKRYGMYYRARYLQDRPQEVNDAEFADMAAHGCTTIKGHTAVEWLQDDDGNITWDFGLIRTTLDQARKHGFFGEITIYDNLMRLAALMGHGGLDEQGEGEPVSEQEDLLAVAKQCFTELKQLEDEYPEFEFLLTHMDEVFGRGRLPRYLDYAEVVRRASDFRLYITIPMSPGRWEDKMERSDPWIDVRCINGHSLESWLQAGHDWDEMAEMLAEAGDEAWMYHNMRGSFFRAEWNRFINGLFMWLSPLEVHVPWMYYSYGGSPFDDTDSDRFDFGYAFPDTDDPTRMISTLHYEAFREGYDDMRYIATLEQTMADARAQGVDVSEAQAWLGEIKRMTPQLPEDIQDIDLESPYTVAATRSFSGADYDTMRSQTARHIIALQQAMGK